MIQESVVVKSIKFIFRDIIFDILYWPIWWYSSGVKKAASRFLDTLSQANDELSLDVWFKNIFKPMYGQYSWDGRIISFFMRLAQIVFRSIIFSFWFIFAGLVFVIWLALPICLIALMLFNIRG
ncbi:hypothetical protein HZB94_03935 [Candidatus Falkowbacteria bacterium]|nr:hypothetical protein [Candidatus Falkowbacteria bacterium]